MQVYQNHKAQATIRRVEFGAEGGGTFGFYHLRDEGARGEVEAWLNATGQQVMAVSQCEGHPVLVTQSNRSPDQNIHALNQQGHAFTLQRQQKPIDPWVVRSILGFGGQSLQLASSFMRPNRKLDWSIFLFAASNLTANGINLAYRAQNLNDPHQLKYLKTRMNDALAPQLQPGEVPPSPEDKRLALRPEEKEKKINVDPVHEFMKRNSVNVGELGLRYLGAFGMAFPPKGWGALAKGKLPAIAAEPLRQVAGFGSLAGKTLALTSKVPDPYNPKPSGPLDQLREKYSFLAGGLIEAAAFTALAVDCFWNSKKTGRGILWRGKEHTDWLGGIGASMFVTGYLVRSWAKYGERNVDMDELYAHASDTLAKAPLEKLPQLVAETAMDIKSHFKGRKDLDFGVIYTRIAHDLHMFHHIDVVPGGAVQHVNPPQPESRIAGPAQSERVVAADKMALRASV